MNISSRKPFILMLSFVGFVVFSFMLFIARQESFLSAITVFKENQAIIQKQQNDLAQSQPRVGQSAMNVASALSKPQRFRDQIDDSGALAFLKDYQDKFAPKNWTLGPGSPNEPTTITQWWQAAAMIDWYINCPLRYNCRNRVAYGNWHACQDQPYQVKPPCLVYSFGINWDYSFDDAMGKLGCEVHSFDPSMGVADHKRSANVTFHNLGLGSINTDAFVAREDMYVAGRKLWKLRTVKAIKEMLGHTDRVIDVFKMDVEGYEWTVIDNMMETDMFDHIRQYMLEFHLFAKFPLFEDYVNLYNIYRRLRELGMREFAIGPHPKTLTLDDFNNQGDSEFVNVNFKPRS